MADQSMNPPAFLEDLKGKGAGARLIANLSRLPDGFEAIKSVELSVRQGHISLYDAPDHEAAILTQCLLGERISVMARRDDWLYVRCLIDGYPGFISSDAVGSAVQTTHWVAAPASHIYPAARIKTAPKMALSMGVLLRVTGEAENRMSPVEQGWVPEQHLRPLGRTAEEPVAAARTFLGSPYLWGGRTSAGLDCSALVQLSFAAAGVPMPRDTDQQQEHLTDNIDRMNDLESGNLVFFAGHVGIFSDQGRLIHANAHHMMAVEEPLQDVVERMANTGTKQPITALKRVQII